MSMSRVIKKYPNRRLYDSEESRYITLGDIRQLVIDDRTFRVIDKKTGSDITRSVLLQVISEQEQDQEHVFSEEFLAQVIRCHGHSDPGSLAHRLEDALRRYLTESHSFSSTEATKSLTAGPLMP
jgi:polyhydroxyalkanoate synthesis repressor PhaR